MERLYGEPGDEPGYLDGVRARDEREHVSRPVNAWSCPNCGTAGFAEQNFCRRCGAPRPTKRPAPITEQVPVIRRQARPPVAGRPLSRVRIALIALLFVVVGGLGALIVDDIRGPEPIDPHGPPPTTPNDRGVAPPADLSPTSSS